MNTIVQSSSISKSVGERNIDALNINTEAAMQSASIWATGCHEITSMMFKHTQSELHSAISMLMAVGAAKSLKDAMDLQTNFARGATERASAQMNRYVEASTALTKQTMAPISARIKIAVASIQ